MKTTLRLIVLATLLLTFARAEEKTITPTLIWAKTLPTNHIVTNFEAKDSDGLSFLDAGWETETGNLIFTVWFSGTNVVSIRLRVQESEPIFTWSENRSSSDDGLPFLDGGEKSWIQLAMKLRARYKIIGDDMFVETTPVKYLGKVDRLSDGILFENHLFVDGSGKYRLIDKSNWMGEAPRANSNTYLGSTQNEWFKVEKVEERFLIGADVLAALRVMESELRAFLDQRSSPITRETKK